MGFKPGYTVVSNHGAPEITYEGADLVYTVEAAKEDLGPRQRLLVAAYPDMIQQTVEEEEQKGEKEGYLPNRGIPEMAELAVKRSGLHAVTEDDVMHMSVKEAYHRLLPYFQQPRHERVEVPLEELSPEERAYVLEDPEHRKAGRWEEVGTVQAYLGGPGYMVRKFLGVNTKTEKGQRIPEVARKYRRFGMIDDEEHKRLLKVKNAHVRGVNLLPHALLLERTKLDIFPWDKRMRKRFTLCGGSNKACRMSCLFASGQIPVAEMQSKTKLAMTEALLMEPEAWMRILVASIERHVKDCASRKDKPYVRLNMLSDIPWELVFPDLFGMFPKVMFYDYTKIAGRRVPRNYDLTFSFNGDNDRLALYELNRGTRVAVVFLFEKEERPCIRYKPYERRTTKKEQAEGKGETEVIRCAHPGALPPLWGEPILNGDIHDVRSLDPEGVVVGLTFKPIDVPHPTIKGRRSVSWKPAGAADHFVIKTWRDDQGHMVVSSVPWLRSR
jgi:hypothetical protein